MKVWKLDENGNDTDKIMKISMLRWEQASSSSQNTDQYENTASVERNTENIFILLYMNK